MYTPEQPPIQSKSKPGNQGLFAHHLLPLLGYTLLTLLYTWPVAANFTTHIPGSGDASWFVWQFWWFKHALLDLRQLPYTTDLLFYPLTDAPTISQTPFNEFFTIPLQLAFNVVVLNNLLFLLSYILSGYFTYLLGSVLAPRRDLAFLGGVFFAFCAYRGMRGWGHMSLLTTQWMPLVLLLGYQLWRRPTLRRGIALGIMVGLVALASPYYIGLFLFPVGVTAVCYLVGRRLQGCWQWQRWGALASAGVIALGMIVAAYLHFLYLDTEIYTQTREMGEQVSIYSADLLSWLLPPAQNPLWGQFTAPSYAEFTTPNIVETTVFVGYLPLVLLVISLFVRWRSTAIYFWQGLTMLSLLMSLGPTLHLHGIAYFAWLPYRFFMALPGFESFRVPSRAGVTAALALSIIAVLVLHQLSQRLPLRLLPRQGQAMILGGIAIFFLVNNLTAFPYPLTDMHIPTFYTQEAESRQALLELPAGEFFAGRYNFFAEINKAMYYQSFHQQPIISGFLGRRPSRLREPERTLPFVRRFFNDMPNQSPIDFPAFQGLPEPYWANEIENAPTLLTHNGINGVALHCQNVQLYCQRAIPLLNHALGLPTAIDGSHRLYRVQAPTYTQHRVPHYLTSLALRYDQAFSPLTPASLGRVYRVTESGTVDFVVPFPGLWQVQGEFISEQTEAVGLQLDHVVLELTDDNYAPSINGWQATVSLAAGNHILTVQPSLRTQGETDARCVSLCLRNLAIRLVQPEPPALDNPLTTLVENDHQQASLLATTLLTTADARDPALQSQWLLTIWHLNATLLAQLQHSPEQLPALFVHLTDADGNTQFQADHRLGERHLRVDDRGLLYDLVPLPFSPTIIYRSEVRLGLWYPERQAYYWSPTGSKIDEANRFRAGALRDATVPILLPAFTIDPNTYRTFLAPRDQAAPVTTTAAPTTTAPATDQLTLLNAQIITATDVTPAQLVTTWRIPYNFATRTRARLFVRLTDRQGKLLTEVEQPLGAQNRIEGESEFVVDTIDLPDFPLPPDPVVLQVRLWQPAQRQWYHMRSAPAAPTVSTKPGAAWSAWSTLWQFSVQP